MCVCLRATTTRNKVGLIYQKDVQFKKKKHSVVEKEVKVRRLVSVHKNEQNSTNEPSAGQSTCLEMSH